MAHSSKLLNRAVEQFSSLPGIGKRTALRLALNILRRTEVEVDLFTSSIMKMKNDLLFCKKCYNLSDEDLCQICTNPHRKESLICVVEDIGDVIAIENTNHFNGSYHVLGGVISPIEGISPKDLTITQLITRVKNDNVKEVVLALSTSIEGETTSFMIYKKLKSTNVKITSIARGISVGDTLEYADEISLGRSITNRIPYDESIAK